MFKQIMVVLAVAGLIGCGGSNNNQESASVTPSKKADFVQQGKDYLAQADIPRAIQSFDKAIRQDPTNPENYLILGQVYLRFKNYDRAADTLAAATKIAPDNGEAWYFLALAKELQGPDQRQAAITAAQRSADAFMKANDRQKLEQSLILVKSLMSSDAAQKQTDSQVTSAPESPVKDLLKQ